MSESEQSSLLCILLDIVSLLQQEESIEKIYGALLLFCNSYLLMHRKNRVIILLTTSDDVKIIYPPTSSNSNLSSTYHELSVTVASQIVAISKEEKQKMTNVKHPSNSTGNYLANGLSKSLCIINRQIQLSKFLPRVLIMQFDKDRVVDYNSFMNSIFNAQKLEILVDALVVSKYDSHILQQACFLTGGLYLRHRDEDDILQILTMHFLLDDKVRKLFNQPLQKTVDFKASCHCHRSPVEYAYMCSVCLTLICEDADVCPVCSSPSRRVAANRAPFKIDAFKT